MPVVMNSLWRLLCYSPLPRCRRMKSQRRSSWSIVSSGRSGRPTIWAETLSRTFRGCWTASWINLWPLAPLVYTDWSSSLRYRQTENLILNPHVQDSSFLFWAKCVNKPNWSFLQHNKKSFLSCFCAQIYSCFMFQSFHQGTLWLFCQINKSVCSCLCDPNPAATGCRREAGVWWRMLPPLDSSRLKPGEDAGVEVAAVHICSILYFEKTHPGWTPSFRLIISLIHPLCCRFFNINMTCHPGGVTHVSVFAVITSRKWQSVSTHAADAN